LHLESQKSVRLSKQKNGIDFIAGVRKMLNILKWLREEFRKILPIWIFFFLSFGLLAITRAAILGEYHITPEQPPEYLAASLIMAKVVVVLDALLKKMQSRSRRLIYVTVWNTLLYCVAALVVHYFEQVFTLMHHEHAGFANASARVIQAMREPGFLVIMIWLVALTFAFCVIREMIASIGWQRVMHMFFGRPPQSRTGTDDIGSAA
jgi:hypothetical protein